MSDPVEVRVPDIGDFTDVPIIEVMVSPGDEIAVEDRVPDIGDFTDVPIIEVMVEPGATVAVEDPLITLESDKATMDVPSPAAGVVRQMCVQVGDRVSEGSLIVVVEPEGAPAATGDGRPAAPL